MRLETSIPLDGIRAGEIILACFNYKDALHLPDMGRVLIVTDKPDPDPDTNARRWMASQLYYLIRSDDREVGFLQFDDTTKKEEMFQGTAEALQLLKPDISSSTPVTIVYLGNKWDNRAGFYNAVADFAQRTQIKTRLAISVGLNRADIKTLVNINSDKQKAIIIQVNNTLKFFDSHPQGSFEITTRHGEETYVLDLKYDTSHSPFHPDWGELKDESPSPMVHEGFGVILNSANIPGGEVYASPYPFSQTRGQFAAHEVLFTVKDGLITGAQPLTENPPESSEVNSIMKEIRSGHPLPVSELGLGVFALAGIKSEPGSSVLAAEKDGPHIGVGRVPGESTEEEEVKILAGDFYHGDLVLDDPSIIFRENEADTSVQFYPPES